MTTQQIKASIRRLSPEAATQLFVDLGATYEGRPITAARSVGPRQRLVLTGFTKAENAPHVFVSPSGQRVAFTNPAKFARDYGLSRSGVYGVICGRLQTTSGWRYANSTLPKSPTYQLKAPDGTLHAVVPSLRAFCRQHGLQAPNVVSLRKGVITQHKGWTLPTS